MSIRKLRRWLTYPFIWLQGELVIAVVSSNILGDLWVTENLFRRLIRTSPIVIQTAVNKRKPWSPCYSHYRGVAGVLAGMPKVDRFLMGGIGGGSFLHTVKHFHPDAEIEAVDIDPVILRLARVFFNISEDAKLVRADLKDYLQEDHGVFDFIFIDAFDGMCPPKELCEKTFLESVAKALSPDGAVCMNTVCKNPWDSNYRKLRILFAEVFGRVEEIYSFEGKILPLLPHNIVLAGSKNSNTF